MTEIYLIRHGVTDYNLQGIFQGITDAPLNQTGLRQADCLGERFRDLPVDRIYASPLLRTMQTAQGANKYKSLPIEQCPGIIEVNGGDLEGRTVAENLRLYPDAMKNMRYAPSRFAAPGGETMEQVYHRVGYAMTDIARENDGNSVIVVSHGCAIRTFLHFITGRPFEELGTGAVNNAAVSKFHYDSNTGLFTAEYLEDDSHLPQELKTPASKMYRMEDEE